MALNKLSVTQFADALRSGHGRALQETLRTGVLRDETTLVEACAQNVAYDPQVEGSRTGWLLEILDAAGAVPRLGERILAGFTSTKTCWDLDQLCEFAEALARRGVPGAYDRLTEALTSRLDPGCPWVAYEPFMRLEGVEGFVRILEDRGGRILKAPEEAGIFDDIIWRAKNILGAERTDTALQSAAAAKPAVAAFAEAMRRLDERASKDTQAWRVSQDRFFGLNGEGFVEQVIQSRPGTRLPLTRGWAKRASSSDLVAVAQALDREDSPERLKLLLQAFHRSVEPAIPRLLALTAHADAEVRRRAFEALEYCRHPDVRALGLERARSGLGDAQTLGLFVRNYEASDQRLIEGLILQFGATDVDETHSFCIGLLDLFGTDRGEQSRASMHFIYERTPCSQCRFDCVKVLRDLGALPPNVAEECKYDSNDETRALVSTA
jgi:hypothetical protein